MTEFIEVKAMLGKVERPVFIRLSSIQAIEPEVLGEDIDATRTVIYFAGSDLFKAAIGYEELKGVLEGEPENLDHVPKKLKKLIITHSNARPVLRCWDRECEADTRKMAIHQMFSENGQPIGFYCYRHLPEQYRDMLTEGGGG